MKRPRPSLSFMSRITLLSVVLSGSVVIIFGLYFVGVLHHIEVERVDRDLRSLIEGQLGAPHPPDHWTRMDESLRMVYGGEDVDRFAVVVRDPWGRILFRSPHWPQSVKLAWPAETPPSNDQHRMAKEPAHGPGNGPDRKGPDDFARGDGRFERPPHGWGHGAGPGPPRPGPRRLPVLKSAVLSTIESPDGPWRLCESGTQYVDMAAVIHMGTVQADVARFRNAFLLALPIILILLAMAGRYLAHRALRPVRTLAQTAEHISASELSRRVPDAGADEEFAKLIHVINRMLGRLEKSFLQSARFSSDAAHELKTPLTVLQGELEQALQNAEIGSGEQVLYSGLLEEVQRLKVITERLLILSMADAGQLSLARMPLNLSDAVNSAADDIEAAAPGLTVQRELGPDVTVNADIHLVRQAIHNLVTNAIKYNVDGGWIHLNVAKNGTHAHFRISNSALNLKSLAVERIFDRFYRADPSRTRSEGPATGSGLGLSLSREIARAHGGDLRVTDCSDTEITLTLTLETT